MTPTLFSFPRLLLLYTVFVGYLPAKNLFKQITSLAACNTAEQPLRRHVRASTLTTLLTIHINSHHALSIGAPHSRSKHQDRHLLQQASMMDELCNSSLSYTLSSPQHRGANGCDTLQLLLSWWPYRNPAVMSLMSLADIYTCELHSELSSYAFF